MRMKSLDFRCSNAECKLEQRDVLVDIDDDSPISAVTIDCTACGAIARHFWPMGTRIAMRGEENVPREQLEAARNAIVRGARGVIPPFMGETRSELRQWEKENNLTSMPGDEAARGNATINTKTRTTESPEFMEKLKDALITAEEIAAAGGDRLAEAKAKIERPNDYDVNSFQQQTDNGIVDGVAEAKGASVPVADIADEIVAAPI